MLTIAPSDPASPEAAFLLEALSDALARLTGASGRASFASEDVRGPRATFVVAHGPDGGPLGCGGLRPLSPDIAELKRLYATPNTLGVGSALLAHLEGAAVTLGYRALWLETRRVNTRAVGFYLRHGYAEIAPYGRYVGRPEAICLGKSLASDERAGGVSVSKRPLTVDC